MLVDFIRIMCFQPGEPVSTEFVREIKAFFNTEVLLIFIMES